MHAWQFIYEREKERETQRETETKVRLVIHGGKDAETTHEHSGRNSQFTQLQLENCFGSQVPEQEWLLSDFNHTPLRTMPGEE